MNNKQRIQQSIQFIEANLSSEIGVSQIAKESCCSLYHFIRLFQSITGFSPKKYLLLRRLTESVQLLRNSEDKIIDIAFHYQFGSHEVYTRSFQKHFGTTPSKVRQGENLASHLLTQTITEDYIFQSKKARNQPPEIIQLQERIIVGSSYFIKGDLKKLDLSSEWNTFIKSVQLIQNKTSRKNFYQIQYWSEHGDNPGMHFFIGIEVSELKNINPQFVIKIIPEGKYLKFIHKGLAKDVVFTYRYIYNEFLPDTEYNLKQPFNFELYPENYSSPYNEQSESFLYIPIEN